MKLNNDNKTVHGLWIGSTLSSLELLTIQSFIDNGHEFHLWLYYQMATPLPSGTVVKDARNVLPSERIFRYKYSDQFGHGKGSLAGFSDIFRYKLLHDYGGWWVDMDVTCLKPLDFPSTYVFRPHHDMPVVGNIMKCPPRSELMQYCYERAFREVDENNRDWHLPIQILNDGIEQMGLSGYIRNITNPESWYENRKMIIGKIDIPENWYAIHWINEEWRRNGINKNYALEGSTLHHLFLQHKLDPGKLTLPQKILTWYRLKIPIPMVMRLGMIQWLCKKWCKKTSQHCK